MLMMVISVELTSATCNNNAERNQVGSAVMAVGRVFMSSAFLLCFSVPLLFSVEDAEPQHRASFSSYPWSFWDEFKSNSNEFNLDLLPVPLRADGHFAPLTRKKFFISALHV